ncbi:MULTISPECIES: hypothetical protein [unclassified Streptomyces]|uniref:hypothetical protein n=1 Tax=unclassified Streptomyces TaxID=2593676 RepID=UPI00037117C2|nr:MULTISPECIES: hypothetical protein [unclassified Streptomyces]MYX39062.1 hypothetical protein [Streptomyces sp. SID8377]
MSEAVADLIDAAAIWAHCREVPVFRDREAAEEHELLLRGHVQLLLGDLPDRLPPVAERYAAQARSFLADDCGPTMWTAYWHLENLAMAGRLLLPLVLGDRAFPCHWCGWFTDSTREVRNTDCRSSSLTGTRYACGPCREARRLVAWTDDAGPALSAATP